MIKVLISDHLSSKAADIFRARGINVDVNIGLDQKDLAEVI